MKKRSLLLLGIVLLAGILRFYQLGSNPPSLTWDEVAWGYNAYSFGIDGKDEFGRLLPYTFLESFGDFKPPVYAYLDIIPVKLFGLTEFATRFPSALFGTLTVLLTYFLVKQLFKKSPQASAYGLFSSLVLAVSPWHIMLSRAAFEANVATFFLVSGVTCFLYWIEKRGWFLFLSVLAFALSLYTFNSARIVAPLLVLMLAISFWKKLWQYKKDVIIAAVVGLIIVLPLVPFLVSPQAGLRYKEVNIFSDPKIVETANQEILNDHNAWWSNILHNRRIAYLSAYTKHYFDNLSPQFLFIKGDGNPKFSTQDVGELYLWCLPFFLIGIFLLFRKREGYWWIIPAWLLLGIVPAATARETPHALRIETTLPTFQILVAYGFINAMVFLKHRFKKKIFNTIVVVLAALYLINISYFLHGYFAHYGWLYAGEWQYGYKESIAYVKSHQQQYDKIFISDILGRPYVYYLFYLQIPPQEFRKDAHITRDEFGFVNVQSFGKYYFTRDINSPQIRQKDALYLIHTKSLNYMNTLPANAHVLKTFYLPDGESVLQAYTLK